MALISVVLSVGGGGLNIGNPITVPIAVPVCGAVPTVKGFSAEKFLFHGRHLIITAKAGGSSPPLVGVDEIRISRMPLGDPVRRRLSRGTVASRSIHRRATLERWRFVRRGLELQGLCRRPGRPSSIDRGSRLSYRPLLEAPLSLGRAGGRVGDGVASRARHVGGDGSSLPRLCLFMAVDFCWGG